MTASSNATPTLHILAGPNGAGKSTLYMTRLAALHPSAEFVNADELAKQAYGRAAVAAEESRAGQRLAEERRQALMRAGRSFVTETTFSHPSKIELVGEARARGYRVVLYHVHVRDPAISVHRVAHRVEAGGHPVPEDKIRERFERNQSIIRQAADVADRTHAFDNSGIGQAARRVVALERGQRGFLAGQRPPWVDDVYGDCVDVGRADVSGKDHTEAGGWAAMDRTCVAVPEELLASATEEARRQGHTLEHQLRRWLRLGYAVEQDSGAVSRVEAALEQRLEPDSLGTAEREVFEDRVGDVFDQPSEAVNSFFADRRERAPMVGYDEEGQLVRRHPDGWIEVMDG